MQLISIAAITTFVSLVVTALFQYAPKVSIWWASKPTNTKKLIIAGVYLVSGAVVAWGGCVAILASAFPQLLCVSPATFVDFAFGVFLAVAAGQGVFGLAPETKAVTLAKKWRAVG